MNDTDSRLIDFLTQRIAQLKELEALADAVMKTRSAAELGDAYRTLIERVQEAWKAVDKADRQLNKAAKHARKDDDDPRLPWFYSLRSALHQASSHARPPVNSRDLAKIHDAAYVIAGDLSYCRDSLKAKLIELGGQE